MEEDLTGLAALLHNSLSHVTQLTVQLTGQDTSRVQKPSITAAAAAVHILGPLCGSLTHITVTGEVRTNGGEQTYTLFLNAASTVASQTLTHLSFRIRAMGHRWTKHHGPFGDPYSLEFGNEDDLLQSGRDFLLNGSGCDALS